MGQARYYDPGMPVLCLKDPKKLRIRILPLNEYVLKIAFSVFKKSFSFL